MDLFFVLSAYLITALLLREYDQRGTVDLKAFFVRRTLRIWPLYYAAVLACFALQFVLPGEHFSGGYLAAFLLFLGNWACVFGGFPVSAVAPLWSVGFEQQFYLTWPLVLRWAPINRLVGVALGMIGLSVTIRLILAALRAPHEALWCDTLARLDPIAVGILLALRPPVLPARAALPVAGLALTGLVLVGFLDGLTSSPFAPVFSYLAAALCSGGLIAGCLQMRDELGGAGRTLAYLGKISYGLYVFHLAFIRIFDVAAPEDWPALALARIALPLAATIVAATLSYELYEKRFLQWKARFAHVASRPA